MASLLPRSFSIFLPLIAMLGGVFSEVSSNVRFGGFEVSCVGMCFSLADAWMSCAKSCLPEIFMMYL
jgi:hypothetical protein